MGHEDRWLIEGFRGKRTASDRCTQSDVSDRRVLREYAAHGLADAGALLIRSDEKKTVSIYDRASNSEAPFPDFNLTRDLGIRIVEEPFYRQHPIGECGKQMLADFLREVTMASK